MRESRIQSSTNLMRASRSDSHGPSGFSDGYVDKISKNGILQLDVQLLKMTEPGSAVKTRNVDKLIDQCKTRLAALNMIPALAALAGKREEGVAAIEEMYPLTDSGDIATFMMPWPTAGSEPKGAFTLINKDAASGVWLGVKETQSGLEALFSEHDRITDEWICQNFQSVSKA